MYFGHRTTNTVTNRVQIDYLKYIDLARAKSEAPINSNL